MELGGSPQRKLDLLKAKSRRRLDGIRSERKSRFAAAVKLQSFVRGRAYRKKDMRPRWHGCDHGSPAKSSAVLTSREIEARCEEAARYAEPQMEGAGQSSGLQIWRIERFCAVPWPCCKYGAFHTGDSYLVLRTHFESERHAADLHFWIGAESTQDEYATAAHKASEVCTHRIRRSKASQYHPFVPHLTLRCPISLAIHLSLPFHRRCALWPCATIASRFGPTPIARPKAVARQDKDAP